MDHPPAIPATGITSGAGFGIRFLARFVDLLLGFVFGFVGGIIACIVLAILQALGATAPGWENRIQGMSGRGMGLSLLGGFLYHCFTEGIHGASFGKMICRLRVITSTGQPCNMARAIQRNLAYYWDALFFGLVAYNSMQKSPRNQRYGDVWAKTVVVKTSAMPEGTRRPIWMFLLGLALGSACWLFALVLGVVLKGR